MHMQNHFRDQPRQEVSANMALTLKPTLTLIGPAAGPRFSRHLRRSSLSLATFRAPPFRQCARAPRPDGRFWATTPAESDHVCLLWTTRPWEASGDVLQRSKPPLGRRWLAPSLYSVPSFFLSCCAGWKVGRRAPRWLSRAGNLCGKLPC